jgi:hypothetical protein
LAWLPCPYLAADVELTDERYGHILARHPDLLPSYFDQLKQTLAAPDEVLPGREANETVFSRWYDSLHGGKYRFRIRSAGRSYRTTLGCDGKAVTPVTLKEADMTAKLTLRYDKVGDILYIDKCAPYAEQDSEEIGDEIAVRLNPKSREVETVEINFFSRRMQQDKIELPVNAKLLLTE